MLGSRTCTGWVGSKVRPVPLLICLSLTEDCRSSLSLNLFLLFLLFLRERNRVAAQMMHMWSSAKPLGPPPALNPLLCTPPY